MPLPIVSLILGKRYIRNRRLPFPLHFCFRAEICMCLTTWEMAAVLVHAQQLCDGQAPHLAHDEHIQPAIIRLRLRPGAETAAVGAAVADGTHQTVHRKGLTVDGVLHPAADVPAQLLHNGQQIGHLPAAQRDAPEFGDAVGHLRVQPGSTDSSRQAEVGLHQVDGHRPAR